MNGATGASPLQKPALQQQSLLPLPQRILIVSSWAPPRPGGSSQQLYNIFSQYDPTSYAIYTRSDIMNAPEPGTRLPCAYHFFPRNGIVAVVREGWRIIKTSNAEVIYVTADGGQALLLGLALSCITRRPMVLHFLDIYRGNKFSQPWGVLAWVIEPLILWRARAAIFPNEAIHEEYRRRYPLAGTKFSCVNNGGFNDVYATLRTPLQHHTPPYHIVFTGSVYWAQEQSIRTLVEAVRGTKDLLLEMYVPRRVPETIARLAVDEPRIVTHSAVPENMPPVQTTADILFIPLSMPRESRVVTMTAVPGKLSEYLLSGRPIVVHAPEGSFMAQYARREGFAHVVTSYDPAILRSEINYLLSDYAYQQRLVSNALRTFERFHNARRNASRISEIIGSIPTTRRASHNRYSSR